LAGGGDEQGVIQARDPDDSGDGVADTGEDQEPVLSEQPVMRRDEKAET
jgi:hypothetical protein